MSKQAKVDHIARKFATMLDNRAIAFWQMAYPNLNPMKVSRTALETIITAKTGVTKFSRRDRDFYVTEWEKHRNIQKYSGIDKMKWLAEKRDCDNFAYYFASWMAMVFKLNSVNVVRVALHDPKTGEYINHHYCNLILARKNGKATQVYYYEPLNDNYLEVNSPEDKVIMGKWWYKPVSLDCF